MNWRAPLCRGRKKKASTSCTLCFRHCVSFSACNASCTLPRPRPRLRSWPLCRRRETRQWPSGEASPNPSNCILGLWQTVRIAMLVSNVHYCITLWLSIVGTYHGTICQRCQSANVSLGLFCADLLRAPLAVGLSLARCLATSLSQGEIRNLPCKSSLRFCHHHFVLSLIKWMPGCFTYFSPSQLYETT